MRLRTALGALLAVVTLSACTPDIEALVAWVQGHEQAAAEAGRPCPQYADDVAFRGLPDHFLRVIDRESNCDPLAVNRGSGAAGLTQIMPFWLRYLCPMGIACTVEDLLDPQKNLDAAAVVYAEQGASAWSQTW